MAPDPLFIISRFNGQEGDVFGGTVNNALEDNVPL
jgi:hypothetical protein